MAKKIVSNNGKSKFFRVVSGGFLINQLSKNLLKPTRISIGKKIAIIVILVGIVILGTTSLLLYNFAQFKQSEKITDGGEVTKQLFALEEKILLMGIISTIGIGIIAFFLSKRISRPLNQLKNATNEIATGNFEVRTNLKTGDEIEALSTTFDLMAKKLQESKMAIKLREDLINHQDEILLKFSDSGEKCCVCIIDIVDSTKTTAKLTEEQTSKFYGIYINATAEIVKKFNGVIVKTLGDGILFYFPKIDPGDKTQLINVLECCFKICSSHDDINKNFEQAQLPLIDYRISITYGPVRIAKVSTSLVEDIFGTTVNRCAKINCLAISNGVVVGTSFYEEVKDLTQYSFQRVDDQSIAKEYDYSVYSITKGIAKQISK